MPRLTFVDGFCPRPYDERSLSDAPLGGTECAVTLLAEALADTHEVEVLQHRPRATHISPRGVTYRASGPWRDAASASTADSVVVVNSPKLLELWSRRAPRAALVLWRHNFVGNRHGELLATLERTGAAMVCVSRLHRAHSLARMGERTGRDSARAGARVTWIPNPVQVHRPPRRPLDPDKLLFCSSPHKGLDVVLGRFARVRERLPSLRLHVANPGYLPDARLALPGLVALGALDRRALHAHMSDALCVFYPQDVFPETFGLVAAEANALGTPVLAPDGFGALPEVMSGHGQLVGSLATDALVARLERWRAGGRPRVGAAPALAPGAVRRAWLTLLDAAWESGHDASTGDGASRAPLHACRAPAPAASVVR